jgi:hypothetical protein
MRVSGEGRGAGRRATYRVEVVVGAALMVLDGLLPKLGIVVTDGVEL